MSVGYKSPLTSANTNSKLMSRTQDTNTVGKLDVNNTTDSSSTSTGALHTTGGLGVEKKAYVNELYVSGLSGSKALQTSALKKVEESSVTSIELSYVSGVTSSIQSQLNTKADEAQVVHVTGNETIGGVKTFTSDTNLNGNVIVGGNLTVNGTTTTVNSATLDVTDTNITVNNGGNDATSEGSGLTVDRTGTKGSLVYENALTSKWKAGDLGSESEVIVSDGSQTITGNKTFSGHIHANGELNTGTTINSTLTGANAVMPSTTPYNILTNASLTSVAGIDDVTNGKLVTITNDTGADITIVNDASAPSVKRIITGFGTDSILKNGSSITFVYNADISHWCAVNGFKADLSPLTTKGDLYTYSTANTRLPVGANGYYLTADSAEATGLKWVPLPTSVQNPRILVYSTSSQTVPSVTLTNITFDNINTDPNYSNNTSWFDTGTYRYTPQKAGTYSVNLGCFLIGTNNRSLISLDLNATNLVHGGSGGVSGDVGMDVSFNVYMNGTTDYISATVYSYSSISTTTSNNSWETYFQATWIGE